MPRGPAWTQEQIDILRANAKLTDLELTELTGRSLSGVKNMRQKIGAPKKRGRKQVHTEKEIVRPIAKWSAEDLEFILDTMHKPINEIATAMGRSLSSVQNARIRVKRANGLHVREQGHKVPEQELWKRPPGTYVEMIGTVLYEHPEVMEHWAHAHGYTSYEVKFQDQMGWTTLICVKEA